MNYKLLLILISLVLCMSLLYRLGGSEFYFLHDELMLMTREEALSSLNTRVFESFGIVNTTQVIVNFFDILYYNFVYFLGMNLIQAQGVLLLLKLLLITLLPYMGFSLIAKDLFQYRSLNLSHFLISFFYSFNSYTIVYWHGNSFSLSLLVCYALAPLTLYLLHKSLFDITSLETKILAAISLFLMSFGFYLFAVFGIFACIYFTLFLLMTRFSTIKFLTRLMQLFLLFVPLTPLLTLIPYEMFFNGAPTVNASGGDTYGILSGGLLYPVFLWFSWGIYTYWEPRNIYTFHNYFKSFVYLLPTILIYPTILFYKPKDIYRKYYIVLLVVFVVLLFLVKGPQAPFGEIFKFLIDRIIVFRIFRSPDNKFGFGIVLSLCLLLLLVHKAYAKKLFLGFMLILCLVHGYLFFSGKVIAGENTATASDRIISISDDYLELLSYLNDSNRAFGYILPSPLTEFGLYNISSSNSHLGQDLIPKISKLPFVHLNMYSSLSQSSYKGISSALRSRDPSAIKKYPIKYILIRKDVASIEPDLHIRDFAIKHARLLFANDTFGFYELPWDTSLISSEDANISYTVLNPSKIWIDVKSNSLSTIGLNQNFSPNWHLYPAETPQQSSFLLDIKYLFVKSLPMLNVSDTGFGSSWEIFSDGYASDRYIDGKFVLYFKPQLYFYVAAMITSSYIVMLCMYVVFRRCRSYVTQK